MHFLLSVQNICDTDKKGRRSSKNVLGIIASLGLQKTVSSEGTVKFRK